MINFYQEGIRLSYHAAVIAILVLLYTGGKIKLWLWQRASRRVWRSVDKKTINKTPEND